MYRLVFITAVLIVIQNHLPLHGQWILEDPTVDIRPEWSNHKIEEFHHFFDEVFIRLDDGSTWKVNADDVAWLAAEETPLLETAITLMPEAGTDWYPVKIIIHNEKGRPWKDFTVNLEAPPALPEMPQIKSVKLSTLETCQILIQMRTPGGLKETTLYINPMDGGIVVNWKEGQKIVICGTWFPEFDPIGRKDYDSVFLYTVFNYHTKEFAFFTF